MIELFIEIYKKEDLCKLLLVKFKEMNLNKKRTKYIMERKSILEKHKSIFNTIISEADNYDYDTIEFYGIILCYLNYYDYDNFTRIINDLYKSKSKELFEILLIYNSHFKYRPINQNFDFFNKLIEYTILNKDYEFFEEGLKYIGDIETFINIIEKNKDNLFNKYFKDNINYLKCTIKLDDYLKFIKTENGPTKSGSISTKDKLVQEINNNPTTIVIHSGDRKETNIKKISKKELEIKNKNFEKNIQNHFIIKFIKKIDLLISFSKIEKIFLIYFTNNFWKYILNNFNEPNEVSIYICYKLREVFMKYYDLVNEIFKDRYKKFTIKYDAINYYELDEFAILLDKNIKKYIINNKKLENIEKLALIKQYNPYYKEERFKYLVDINIFDLFDFNNIDNEFIEDFRNMRFENIFKENINEFINKIFSKIKKISDFDHIIKIINIKNIEDKNIFLNILIKACNKIIKKEFEKKLDNFQILARLAILFFKIKDYKFKFKFIENTIKKLDEDIIIRIFIEIMRIYINQKNKEKEENEETDNIEIEKEEDFYIMKDYILRNFINLKKEKDIENIMSLIDCFEGKEENANEINDKKKKENKEIIDEFLNLLLDKYNLFISSFIFLLISFNL